MLIHSRLKLTNKKLATTILDSTNHILSTNPEIQNLVDKLLVISQSLPEQRPKTLNLIQWQKEKYRPSQNQNRIRIQNQISLIKAMKQRVRSRVKPIKRAMSIDLSHQHSSKSYKQHYEEIKQSLGRKISCSQAYESQQEAENTLVLPPNESESKGGIKYYQNLKKYNRIIQFINDRMDNKLDDKKGTGIKTFYSQSLPTSPNSRQMNRSPMKKHNSVVEKEKYVRLADREANSRVTSIVKKWKPMSKIQRIFDKTVDDRSRNRKKLVWEGQKTTELAVEPSINTEITFVQKSSIEEQLNGKQIAE